MIFYIIKAVQYDENDLPVAVIWRMADHEENEWVSHDAEADVAEVIAALDEGQTVLLEWFDKGRAVMGPKVRKTTYPDGRPGIESADPNRPINEMPYFD